MLNGFAACDRIVWVFLDHAWLNLIRIQILILGHLPDCFTVLGMCSGFVIIFGTFCKRSGKDLGNPIRFEELKIV